MIYNVYIYRFIICIWIVYDIEKIWYKPKTRTIYIKNTWYAVDISGVHGQEKGHERCYRFACPFTFTVEQKCIDQQKDNHPPFEVRAMIDKQKVGWLFSWGRNSQENWNSNLLCPTKQPRTFHTTFFHESGRILGHSKVVESGKDLQGYLMTCCKTYFLRIFLDLTCDLPERFYINQRISPKSPVILGCLLSTVFLLFGATVNVRIFSRRSKLLAAKKNYSHFSQQLRSFSQFQTASCFFQRPMNVVTGWWFQRCFIFIPTWGNDPVSLIFCKWFETTN